MVRSDWFIPRLDMYMKVFKYIRNIQNLILDAGWISKWKVLFDLFFNISNYRPGWSIRLTFLYSFLKAQESLRAQYKEWRNSSVIHNEKRDFT